MKPPLWFNYRIPFQEIKLCVYEIEKQVEQLSSAGHITMRS